MRRYRDVWTAASPSDAPRYDVALACRTISTGIREAYASRCTNKTNNSIVRNKNTSAGYLFENFVKKYRRNFFLRSNMELGKWGNAIIKMLSNGANKFDSIDSWWFLSWCLSLFIVMSTILQPVRGAAVLDRHVLQDTTKTLSLSSTTSNDYSSERRLSDSKFGGCTYNNINYIEGHQVITNEPCLNCTCVRGSLLCYLRVCPELPDPPPSGCVIVHRYRACCAELICPDFPNDEHGLDLSRMEPDIPRLSLKDSTSGKGCVYKGSIFAAGSAMPSKSSSCEYCYCLDGHPQCVQPRCGSLKAPGCIPIRAAHACCPIRYDCSGEVNATHVNQTKTTTSTSTTTTILPTKGCWVGERLYEDGARITEFGDSKCDICYCMQHIVRCESLSCAPPLLGCEPVIPAGRCCASSYNCSGTIEVEPMLQNFYDTLPDVSPTYAKLRKEVTHDIRNYDSVDTNDSYPDKSRIFTTRIDTTTPMLYHNSKYISKDSDSQNSINAAPGPYYIDNFKTRDRQKSKNFSNSVDLDGEMSSTNLKIVIVDNIHKHSNSFKNNRDELKYIEDYNNYQQPIFIHHESSSVDGRNNRRIDSPKLPPANVTNETTTEYVSTVTNFESKTDSQTQETTDSSTLTTVTVSSTDEDFTTTESFTTDTFSTEFSTEVLYSSTLADFNNDTTDKSVNMSNIYENRTEIITIENCTHVVNEKNISDKLNSNKTNQIQINTVITMNVEVNDNKRNQTKKPNDNSKISANVTRLNLTDTNNLNQNLTKTSSVLKSDNTYRNNTKYFNLELQNITNEQTDNTDKNTTVTITNSTVNNNTDNFNNISTENNLETLNKMEKKHDSLNESMIQERLNDKNDIKETSESQVKFNKSLSDSTPQTDSDDDILSSTTLDDLDIILKNSNLSDILIPNKKIPLAIEASLNILKHSDPDYEYSFKKPTLPPSLPNVRIIPFEPSDAVDKDKEVVTVPYASVDFNPTYYPSLIQDKGIPTENPIFSYDSQTLNLFSPPNETQGGFVPREPPILDSFYNNGYHSTAIIDLAVGTAVPSITNPPKTDEDNCISKGREYHHGELISEPEECIMCICFFGDIVCQPPKCPQLNPGCHRLPAKDPTICCGHVICENVDSPTVVLDRIDVTLNPSELITVAEGITTPDPFKDVIRTEPAPDLQSLIGDMIPFLQRFTSTTMPPTAVPSPKTTTQKSPLKSSIPSTTSSTPTTSSNVTNSLDSLVLTTMAPPSNVDHKNDEHHNETKDYDEGFSFDKVLQFLFSEEEIPTNKYYTPNSTSTSTTTAAPEILESRIVNHNSGSVNFNSSPNKNKYNYKFNKTQINNNQATKRKNTTTEAPIHKNISEIPINIPQQNDSTEILSTTSKTFVTPLPESDEQNSQNMIDASTGIGLLKLAGCNIYGRMYRVGRIIAELSGPCLECMCTNIGVQCRPLIC